MHILLTNVIPSHVHQKGKGDIQIDWSAASLMVLRDLPSNNIQPHLLSYAEKMNLSISN